MSLSITSIKNERGPAVKVVFFVKCKNYGKFEADEGPIIIDSAASVIFKFSCLYPERSSSRTKFTVMTSVKSLLKEKIIKVNISCKQLSFSKQLCANYEGPEDWQLIGNIETEMPEYCFELKMISSRTEIFTFAKLYNDAEFTDFLLRSADGGTVAVHKACLGAHSDVFKQMLLSKFKETAEGCIEFKDVSLQTLQHLKNYMYLGTLPDKGVEPLLLIAKCYMMASLLEEAINKVCQTATPANLCSLLKLATENNIPELALGLLQMASDEAVNSTVIDMQKLQPVSEVKESSKETVTQ